MIRRTPHGTMFRLRTVSGEFCAAVSLLAGAPPHAIETFRGIRMAAFGWS
jgi:hypothetical protein